MDWYAFDGTTVRIFSPFSVSIWTIVPADCFDENVTITEYWEDVVPGACAMPELPGVKKSVVEERAGSLKNY